MSSLPPVAEARVASRGSRTGQLSDFASLAKPRVNSLVLVTTGLGYLLSRRSPDLPVLLWALVGTGLVAGGAAAFNQVWERELDSRMRRTARRALPAGRIEVVPALLFAFALSVAGILQLLLAVNAVAAALAASSLILYVLVYTPLKRVTSLATVVGAIPGAIPPMIGWAAGTGGLEPGAWVLFTILFLWQMPHFLAIAWLYRQDYARAGFPMLPVVEPGGASTGRQALLYAATLLPVSIGLTALRITGRVYFLGALVCGVAFVAAALVFAIRRSTPSARWLFWASILYLPVLLTLAYWDKVS
ncbi:MAG: heme o synthase [Thermoanaerobaculia bacterium]